MDKEIQRNYAKLIASTGVNITEGCEVVINAQLDQPEFIVMLVEECYKLGAKKVMVEWNHQAITKLHADYRSLEVLGKVEPWEESKLKQRAEVLPCMIYIESEDPDGLSGIDREKWAKSQQMRYKVIKPIRDTMEDRYRWCIAAVPGKAWAKKVFPELEENEAVEKLWEAILFTARAQGDAVENWKKHNEEIKQKSGYLNSLKLKSLHYTSKNGTDFNVGLIPDAKFEGGCETAKGDNVWFNPNIPSEEIFTSPMKGEAEGIVYSTRPLSYRGVLIENFSIRFENGKAVEVHAEKNEESLKTMIGMDEGACYLGECALVPYDSPIRNSGIMFYNTLFDENAACHLALGAGFCSCLNNFENMSLEECHKAGINESMIHEDFMIGSEDLCIDGITAEGKTVPIFVDGGWAF